MKKFRYTFFGIFQISYLYIAVFFLISLESAYGFGSMGPISAAFGDDGFFCAIDASGKQAVICWGKNSSSSSNNLPEYIANVPQMAALSGGDGFLCGILANTSQAYCWSSMTNDLVPPIFQSTSYSHIASGMNHVCAITGSYYSENDLGSVDCWDIVRKPNGNLSSEQSNLFYDPAITNLVMKTLVSGEGFSCGFTREDTIVCWGPNATSLNVSNESENFFSLASGRGSLCGLSKVDEEVHCWGYNSSFKPAPVGIGFVSLAAGAQHFCGIREDTHGIECWGSFNSSSIPKGSGFLAIASSDYITCGIREDDLVLDCWFTNMVSTPDYDPPFQLCSPGLCTPGSCGEGKFAFNASSLHETDLTSLCVRKDLSICSPCGLNCSEGFFPSSSCSENADRVCTACSLCQNSSCWDICKIRPLSDMQRKHHRQLRRLILIVVASASALVLILFCWCLSPSLIDKKNQRGTKKQFALCIGKSELETEALNDSHPPVAVTPCPGVAQIFRLSELKDATNGFKEFNELGRGSYGFVYKALLPDGRQVAVKRANAATIIHTNNRDFEMELEILCSVRHSNIVNLLGYCAEMGERLLVYEYMPHGTLHDHLHGGLSPPNWTLRLKIALQAAKGLEYLHKEVSPPIVHHDVKSSNILLDADWGARIADFGLLTLNESDVIEDIKADVYNFGIVLLEILSGRKAYDRDCVPPSIVDWAMPLIRQGKAAATIDKYALPRNVEPLLKLADAAELALRENPSERPTMTDLVLSLEHLAKDTVVL